MDLNDVFTAQNNVSQQVTEVLLGKMNVE